jgi:hypothetical protein
MHSPQPTVVFFCMPGRGHFQALCPVIARVVGLGMSACVFTDARYQQQIQRYGGRFIDLFDKYPIALADDESIPIPCRNVSFAGLYAGQVIRDVRPLKPSLIIYEMFAVIGPVVAQALGVPYVCVCPGHNVNPSHFLSVLENDRRVAVSGKVIGQSRSSAPSSAKPTPRPFRMFHRSART